MRIQSEYQSLVRRCVRIGRHLGYTVKVVEVEEDGIGIEVGDFEFRVVCEKERGIETYFCYVILSIPATYHEPPDFDEKELGTGQICAERKATCIFKFLELQRLNSAMESVDEWENERLIRQGEKYWDNFNKNGFVDPTV